MGKKVGKQI